MAHGALLARVDGLHDELRAAREENQAIDEQAQRVRAHVEREQQLRTTQRQLHEQRLEEVTAAQSATQERHSQERISIQGELAREVRGRKIAQDEYNSHLQSVLRIAKGKDSSGNNYANILGEDLVTICRSAVAELVSRVNAHEVDKRQLEVPYDVGRKLQAQIADNTKLREENQRLRSASATKWDRERRALLEELHAKEKQLLRKPPVKDKYHYAPRPSPPAAQRADWRTRTPDAVSSSAEDDLPLS